MGRNIVLLTALLVWTGIAYASADTGVEVVKTEYQQRPFSWYYPYDYQYYTPHQSPYQNEGNGCYWFYTNGAYVYTCS